MKHFLYRVAVAAIASLAFTRVGADYSSKTSLVALTGLVDADRLTAHADSLGAPHRPVWGIAWQESRTGVKGNNVLGQGILVPDITRYVWTGRTTGFEHPLKRVCREVGRMQLNPCVNWTQVLHDQRCTLHRITVSYDDNVHCGIENMLRLARTKGWTYVPSWYNGGNAQYQKEVEQYLGHLTLKELK
jgi:hypothetical protein